ncbi:MAG: single-stranded-DNA-specific exonuclease RecJ [Flavobacteriales bacterium]|nr:single-stranded-DNA-specific exonuclease RecJ [Flavobacteriales bacterium]
MLETEWKYAELPDPAQVSELCEHLGVKEDVAQLLINRGITNFDEARSFFRPSFSDLHDPFLMKGMDKAIERIEQALGNGEKTLIFGDYDVDGTTSVALVYSFFKDFGQVDFYIPDRYKEGYGLSIAGIDYAKANGISLIITLDCGIRAIDKVAYANKLGIDIIICDHHLPGAELPAAYAILDPKQADCNYPYKELCGCGVGFKLLQAFCEKNNEDLQKLTAKLDLVSVAIAADIVPITGENRILASFGVRQINENPSTGIRALLEYTKMNREMTISDVVFTIAPRINAAGRIASGKRAVELLISDDLNEALEFSAEISKYNTERRDLDKSVTDSALEILQSDDFYSNSKSTVVFNPDWHKGVVGIVASRLIEQHYKPTIVLTESEGKATGSARSVHDFDVHAALTECEDLLEQFGGHKYAAGMSLSLENVDAFRTKFEEVVAARIEEHMLTPKLNIDLEIDLDRITPKFMSLLKQFAPFGPGNMNPVFVSRNLIAEDVQTMGADNSHLRFKPKQQGVQHMMLQAVAFKMGKLFQDLSKGKRFDMAYTIEENHWKDKVYLQLNVKDLKFSD